MSKEQELTDYLNDIIMGVDLMTVWKVSQERLPELKSLFEKLALGV
jgi:uncharacterized protein with HEPN domain